MIQESALMESGRILNNKEKNELNISRLINTIRIIRLVDKNGNTKEIVSKDKLYFRVLDYFIKENDYESFVSYSYEIDYGKLSKFLNDKVLDYIKRNDIHKLITVLEAAKYLHVSIKKSNLKTIKQSIKNKKIKSDYLVEFLNLYIDKSKVEDKINELMKEALVCRNKTESFAIYRTIYYLYRGHGLLNNSNLIQIISRLIEIMDYNHNSTTDLIDISIENNLTLNKKTLKKLCYIFIEKKRIFYSLYCHALLNDKENVIKIIKDLNEMYKDYENKYYKFIVKRIKGKRIWVFNVLAIKNQDKFEAELFKDYDKKSLKLKLDSEVFEINFDRNWFYTLRKLDDVVNKKGYKILCNGTSKYVYARGFCVTMGDGSSSYRIFRDQKRKYEIVNTFEYSPWNEYTTKEEQEISFFGKEVEK